nr:MAG TPA: hypothetical protein [Caudoviricetes sp.]
MLFFIKFSFFNFCKCFPFSTLWIAVRGVLF